MIFKQLISDAFHREKLNNWTFVCFLILAKYLLGYLNLITGSSNERLYCHTAVTWRLHCKPLHRWVFFQIIDNVTKKCALLEKEMHQTSPQIFARYTHVRGKGWTRLTQNMQLTTVSKIGTFKLPSAICIFQKNQILV